MTVTGGSRRAAAFGAMLGVLSLGCAASAAYAQALVLPDGKFASKRDYLYGTWVWERQSPRQTVQMRFSRKGDFFFYNLTTGLSHYGRFESRAKRLYLVIRRTCTNNGKKCANRNPPRKVDYDFRPVRADQFISSDEDWRRKSRE